MGGVADKVKRPPSEYYREHVYGCFFADAHGLKSLDAVGVDNITFETDYPHSDSTWPDTLEVAMRIMADLLRAGRFAGEIMNVLSSAGRNDPCPCGSGRKTKACHGGNR